MGINRNSFLSLIESVNAATSEKVINEGPDWDTHKSSVKQKPKTNNPAKSKVVASSPHAVSKPQSSNNSGAEAIAETKQNMAVSEDFDQVDRILAEGIELYGEEGMTKILSHFEKTGKISRKLANLINTTDR